MKLLLVHNFHRAFKPSGEDVAYRRERELLQQSEHEVHTFERSTDETAEYSTVDKLRLATDLHFNEQVYDALRQQLQLLRPHLVHVHNTFPLLSSSVFAACQHERVPVVLTLHNHYLFCAGGTCTRDGHPCTLCLTTRNPWHAVRYGCYGDSHLASLPMVHMIRQNWLQGFWERNIDGFITLTQDGRERFFEAGLPPEKVFVKPNFLPDPEQNTAIAAASLAESSDAAPRRAVLFIGRLSEEKGVGVLLEAARRMQASGQAVPIQIVGGGPDLADYRERAASLPHVTFLDQQPQEVCLRMAREALCVVVPSICSETFGLTVIEAFASRTPVVASRLASLAELVDHGRTGLTFETGDARALAEALGHMAHDPQRAAEMGIAARADYEAHYTPANNLRQLLAIYDRVLHAHGAVPSAQRRRFSEVEPSYSKG